MRYRGSTCLRSPVGVLLLVGWVGAALAGCQGDPENEGAPFWRPWYEPPAEPETDPEPLPVVRPPPPAQPDGGAPPVATGTPCQLAVTVTTATLGGNYAPNNIGAIWVADQGGRFVKTLRVWADRRREHLGRWIAVTRMAGTPNSKTDAVTSATLTRHGVRTATWDCTDTARNPVPAGVYEVCFELTEANGPGPVDCVPFTRGPAPSETEPADRPTFKRRKLVYAP